MNVGIFSNEQYVNAQKNSIGSSRIRCKWVLNHWLNAEEFRIGVKYDAVIFQKAYFLEYMRMYDGVKILDLCDPDWMEGKPVMQAIELCDSVTVSSQGLFDYLKEIAGKPVYLIPDRVDLNAHTERKEHGGEAKSCVWFGYSHNQQVLDEVLPTLKRLRLGLTVISDLPYFPTAGIQGVDKEWITANIRNIKFDPETLNTEILAGGDVVLNNRPNTGKFYFKSDNKTIIAWALGMPVALNAEDLERFLDEKARRKEAEMRLNEVREYWQSERSVEEYENVIRECLKRKRIGESV